MFTRRVTYTFSDLISYWFYVIILNSTIRILSDLSNPIFKTSTIIVFKKRTVYCFKLAALRCKTLVPAGTGATFPTRIVHLNSIRNISAFSVDYLMKKVHGVALQSSGLETRHMRIITKKKLEEDVNYTLGELIATISRASTRLRLIEVNNYSSVLAKVNLVIRSDATTTRAHPLIITLCRMVDTIRRSSAPPTWSTTTFHEWNPRQTLVLECSRSYAAMVPVLYPFQRLYPNRRVRIVRTMLWRVARTDDSSHAFTTRNDKSGWVHCAERLRVCVAFIPIVIIIRFTRYNAYLARFTCNMVAMTWSPRFPANKRRRAVLFFFLLSFSIKRELKIFTRLRFQSTQNEPNDFLLARHSCVHQLHAYILFGSRMFGMVSVKWSRIVKARKSILLRNE